MKNNLTMLFSLCILALIGFFNNAIAQCIPAGTQPVIGTITGNTGTQTFNNIATGSVIEVVAPAGGIAYNIDMCATNTAGWADGTNDAQVTVLDANSAAANGLALIDDGCTNGAGPNFWGPSAGAYTSTAAGTIYFYITEWTADGSAQCIADGVNSAYTMTVTLSNAATCATAAAPTIVADDCTDWNASWSGTATGSTVPGADADAGFAWIFLSAAMTTPMDPFNDPAFLGSTGVQGSSYNVSLPNSGAANTLPVGVYYAYVVVFGNAVTNADGSLTVDPACTFVSNGEVFEFKADGSTCTPSTCLAPTATAVYDCASSSIIVDVTDAGMPSTGAAGYFINAGGSVQTMAGPGQYTFPAPADVTDLVVITDSLDNTCNVAIDIIPDCITPCAGATEGVVDGGLEGAAGTAWTEVSTDPAGTPTGFGVINAQLPLNGVQGAWLGGWGTDGSITSISQSITIPANSYQASLTFWALEAGDCAAADVFTVSVDGAVEFTQDGTNANCSSGNFHLYTVDLSAYNDGAAHTLTFQYSQLAMVVNSNLFIDDISLEICTCPVLVAAAVSTPETCADADGTATVAASGAANLTYLWSDAAGQTTATATGLSAGNYTVTVTDADTGCETTAAVTVANLTSTTALTVTVSATGENCGSLDGTATVDMVTGGSGNYAYAWASGATTASVPSLAAGTYPVTVTDMMTGCSGTATASVGSTGGPTVVVDMVTNVTCNTDMDGSIMITVSGGTMPYTFAWSNGSTDEDLVGVAAGDYSGTVTDGAGCPFVVNATITEPDAVAITVDALMNVSCNGAGDGAIMITTTGGTAPYTYAWSDGSTTEDISGLAPGDYSGTITDANGCELVAGPVNITEPDAIAVAVDGTTDATCNGGTDGSIMITVSGGTAPYTFAWSDGSTSEDLAAVAAGEYTGTITDANGCELVAGPVTIAEPDAISVAVDAVEGSTGADGSISITVSGGTAPYTFVWSNGSTDEDLTGLAAGDFTGTITDANGCTLVAGPVNVTDLVDVENIEAIASFSLKPNPTADVVRVEMMLDASYDVQVQIIDVAGRLLATDVSRDTNQAVFELDMSSYADGIYFARFIVDGELFTEKIVKTSK